MESQTVASALIEKNVSVDQFYEFIVTYGIQEDPFIRDVLQHLLIYENIPSSTEDIVESWLIFSEIETEPAMKRGSPDVTDSQCDVQNDEFEPWSQGFQEVALMHEDIASTTLACLQDGEFKLGKTFYCSRCKAVFSGYQAYSRHRQGHDSASPTPGPSGVQQKPKETRTPEPMDAQSPLYDCQVGGADEPAYRIELTGTRRFARAVAVEKTYKVRFNDQWQGRRLGDLRRQLHHLFEQLLVRARDGINDNDLLRVVIRHDALNHAVVVPLQAAGDMNVEKILSKIENVLQSEETLAVDDSFQVIVGALHIPQGAGGPRRRITKLTGPDNSIHKKTSMVQIVNNDQLCMARAIGVCFDKHCLISTVEWRPIKKAHKYKTSPEILVQERKISAFGFTDIKNKNHQEQKHLAVLLCQKAGVPADRPGSLNDLPSFEEALQMRIAMVAASLGNKFIRVPDNEHEDWPLIYLYLVDHEGVSHFYSIVNITGFFSSVYFCDRYFKQYDHNTEHRCATTCLTCKSQDCPETDTTMSCRDCHMVCRSLACFERHRTTKPKRNGEDAPLSSCDKFWQCVTCKKVVNREQRSEEKHRCSEWLCKSCRSWVNEGHRCFLFPAEPPEPTSKFVFFDFEATQDQIAQCKEGYSPKR